MFVSQSELDEPNNDDGNRGVVTYPLPDGIVVERDVWVEMRDGARLNATVFRPEVEDRYPVIMSVTVYGKDRGPAEYSTLPKIKGSGNAVGTLRISDVTPWEAPDPGFWVLHGYVVIIADARGYYRSEGEGGIYSDKDPEDYHDLIEWAGVQRWSTGAVGLNGVSYLAISQWLCASRTKPAHLKAIVPWEGASDLLRDVIEHGGIPETRFLPGYYSGSLALGAGEAVAERGQTLIEASARHPFPLETIEVPALICGSWSLQGLHSRGAFEGFMRISSRQKWLYTHGGCEWDRYYSADALEWQKAFLDHFLKADDNGFDRRPPVRLEVRRTKTEHAVRAERTWPIGRVSWERRFLDLESGRLSLASPAEAQHRDYDAETNETLQLDLPFDRPTEITGPMVLTLWAAALDADDLDLFIALRKYNRAGRQVQFMARDGFRQGLVSLGWLRASQRHVDPQSAPWRPHLTRDRTETVAPGNAVEMQIEILPSSTAFDAGESMRLLVSGRDILQFARFGHDRTVNKGHHRVHAGGDRPSSLLVPFC